MKEFETYEQVATFLLDQFADRFGLTRVEGKQNVPGLITGTSWEIDGKGVKVGDDAFLIVESRRLTGEKLKQEAIAAVAYRIRDTGAAGGIVVSPLGLQKGAAKVATAEKIVSVHLDPSSTTSDYVLRFLNSVMRGASLTMEGTLELKVQAAVKRTCSRCGTRFVPQSTEPHCPE